jgi:hypothetical protein
LPGAQSGLGLYRREAHFFRRAKAPHACRQSNQPHSARPPGGSVTPLAGSKAPGRTAEWSPSLICISSCPNRLNSCARAMTYSWIANISNRSGAAIRRGICRRPERLDPALPGGLRREVLTWPVTKGRCRSQARCLKWVTGCLRRHVGIATDLAHISRRRLCIAQDSAVPDRCNNGPRHHRTLGAGSGRGVRERAMSTSSIARPNATLSGVPHERRACPSMM